MYYDVPAQPRSATTRSGVGYHLANSTGSAARQQYTPPPNEVSGQDCPSCGTQWAADNAVGIGFGIVSTLVAGVGLGYLLSNSGKKDDKPAPTLNSLRNYAASYST
jgi:hypothetical protein